MSEGQTQTKESRPVVFIRKHPDLEPILEEADRTFTTDEIFRIEEHAFLFREKPRAPLTCTCETGSARYAELKQDPKYVERTFQYTRRGEIHVMPVEDEFYWREVNPTEK